MPAFDHLHLETLLARTGLPCRSPSFLHGALTAQAVLSLFLDDLDTVAEEDAFYSTLIFNIPEEDIPKVHLEPALRDDVIDYLLRHQTYIRESLPGNDIEPCLAGVPDNGSGLERMGPWCGGFTAGILLRVEGWEEKGLIDERGAEDIFKETIMFRAGAQYMDWREGDDAKTRLEELTRNPEEYIRDALNDFYLYIISMDVFYRCNDTLPRAVARKPGRNEPCPCKSGKKYKKCCGQAD